MSGSLHRKVYWVSTSLLAAAMLGGGIQEIRRVPELVEAAQRLGYPEYIFTLLGTAKVIGAPLLVIQGFPRLKEWVYAGFTFDFGGAIASHTMVDDTLLQTLPALLCAVLLALSYWSYRTRGAPFPGTGQGGEASSGVKRWFRSGAGFRV